MAVPQRPLQAMAAPATRPFRQARLVDQRPRLAEMAAAMTISCISIRRCRAVAAEVRRSLAVTAVRATVVAPRVDRAVLEDVAVPVPVLVDVVDAVRLDQ